MIGVKFRFLQPKCLLGNSFEFEVQVTSRFPFDVRFSRIAILLKPLEKLKVEAVDNALTNDTIRKAESDLVFQHNYPRVFKFKLTPDESARLSVRLLCGYNDREFIL